MNPLLIGFCAACLLIALLIGVDAWRDRARFSRGGRA